MSAGASTRWVPTRAAVFAVVTLFAGCSGFRSASESWDSVRLGLCEDYPEESRTLEKAYADLAFARATGAKVLRVAFGWDAMEPERGHYDWSFWDDFVRVATQHDGLRLIPYVCYTPKWAARDQGADFWRSPPNDPGDFGRFMSAIVARYRYAVHSWELWNEPDNPAYWLGTNEEFAALVRAGSAGVRRSDPRAVVVLGGIATELSFLETLFRVQRIAPAVDVVNLHSYYETWHPEPIERLPEYIGEAAEIVRAHGEREPLWLAETGYSSVGPRVKVSEVYASQWRGEHTDEAQADALARTLLLGLGTRQLSLVAWYRINDLTPNQDVIGDDNNRHLGLRRADATPKPATAAFSHLAALFAQPFHPTALPMQVLAESATSPVVRSFVLRDNRHVIAVWMAHAPLATSGASPGLKADHRAAVLRIELPFVPRAFAVTNAIGEKPVGRVAAGHGARERQLILEMQAGEVLLCVVSR